MGRTRGKDPTHASSPIFGVASALLSAGLLLLTLSGSASGGQVKESPRSAGTSIPAPAIGAPSAFLETVTAGRPTTFIAQWQNGGQSQLEEFSASSGAPLGEVAALPNVSGVAVTGPYRSGSTAVWITTTGGPIETSNDASGDPLANSCNATVSVLDPTNREPKVAYAAPSSELVTNVVPSSRGEYAYLVGSCTSYLNQHIIIKSSSGALVSSIGLSAVRCHSISPPSWNLQGTEVTFSYGPSAISGVTRSPPGVCPSTRPGEVAIVSASRSSAITSKDLTMAPKGCSYVTSAFDSLGIVAVATCGPIGHSSTYLAQLTKDGAFLHRFGLKPNSDPTTLSVTPNGRFVLVDEYQADALPHENALDWVWIYNGQSIREVSRYADSTNGIRSASW